MRQQEKPIWPQIGLTSVRPGPAYRGRFIPGIGPGATPSVTTAPI